MPGSRWASSGRSACRGWMGVEVMEHPARRLHRAKLIASILSNHGHSVTPPDEADLDDVELERWEVCVEIERAMSET